MQYLGRIKKAIHDHKIPDELIIDWEYTGEKKPKNKV